MTQGKRRNTTLGAEAEILAGFPFKSAEYVNDPAAPRLLRGDNVVQGSIRWDDAKHWPESKLDGLTDYALQPGDVVLAMDRPWIEAGLKYAAITAHDLPALLVQRVARLRGKNGLDQRFLKYVIGSADFTDYILAVQTGTSVPHISGQQIKDYKFECPPIAEQHAIARVLGALDDKIELNRRMNRTLEQMAAALFKSWFVDFDPVTAKAEGRRPFGMSAETAALFPAAFQDSVLGPIPQGWKTGIVGEEYNLTMGQSPPGNTYNELGEGTAFYQGRTDFGFRYPTPRVFCTAPTRLANAGDTLVSVRAPVGDVNRALENCSIGRGVSAIRHKSGSRSFTYYAMRSLGDEFDVFEGEGTLFGSIGGSDFRGLKIIVPEPRVVAEFERRAHPFDQSIENNERQVTTLASIRDALLPKLLSGEIRVKAAEKQVERAIG